MKSDFKYNNLPKCKKAIRVSNKHIINRQMSDSKLSISHLDNKNFFIPKSKRSQGEVISTILLILLVIAASVMIISFIIPFIQNILKGTKCSDYNGKIYSTENSKYTCYNSAKKILFLQIKFNGNLDKKDAELIKGLKIVVETGTDSKIFELTPPNSLPPLSIQMYDGHSLELPQINEEKTYNISTIDSKPSQVIIYPVLKDNQNCATVAHTINFVQTC